MPEDTKATGRPRGGRLAKAASGFSIALALALIVAKGWAWRASGSVGVLSSLADSSLDLAASAIAAAGVWFAARPADANHRYGHGKGEAAAALAQATIICISAGFVVVEAAGAFLSPEPLRAGREAMIVMAGGIAATMVLVAVQTLAVRREGSLAVEAERAHYLGDIASQAGVFAAIWLAGALGAPRLDAAAGLAVAGVLALAGASVARKALRDLLDEELPDAERDEIARLALEASGALGVHDLRTRRAGLRLFVQLHLDFPAATPLVSAHDAGERAAAAIRAARPDADVFVHHDPVRP